MVGQTKRNAGRDTPAGLGTGGIRSARSVAKTGTWPNVGAMETGRFFWCDGENDSESLAPFRILAKAFSHDAARSPGEAQVAGPSRDVEGDP